MYPEISLTLNLNKKKINLSIFQLIEKIKKVNLIYLIQTLIAIG